MIFLLNNWEYYFCKWIFYYLFWEIIFDLKKKLYILNGRMVIYKIYCKNVLKLIFDIIIKLFDYKIYIWIICVNIIIVWNFLDKIWCFLIGFKFYVWYLNGFFFFLVIFWLYIDYVNYWLFYIVSVFDYSCWCFVII